MTCEARTPEAETRRVSIAPTATTQAALYRFFLPPGFGPPLGFLAPLLLPGPLSPTSHLRHDRRVAGTHLDAA